MATGMTKRQREVLDRIAEDGAVVRLERGFAFVDGSPIHARIIRNLMEKGVLVESGDAMFGVESQTLKARMG